MNADGSAGVSVDARVGATVPALTGLAWGLLGAGLFLVLIGVLADRARRPAPPVAGSTALPSGGPYGPSRRAASPPPSWTPPAPVDRSTAADAGWRRPASSAATRRLIPRPLQRGRGPSVSRGP